MSLIRPFTALRPALGFAKEVAAPPYDVVSREEAAALATDHPWRFLHISRAEIDLPLETHPYDPMVYAKAAANLQAMKEAGVLIRETTPCYYVYRMIQGNHQQTGLAAAVSISAYKTGRVQRHELTRPDKEDDRVRQIEALNAQTGPVLLAYRTNLEVQRLLAEITQVEPDMAVTMDNGVQHQIWTIQDLNSQSRLTDRFEAMPRLYIADGHHRSAAATRIATQRGADDTSMNGYFLGVMFPDEEMCILDYNRLVKDLQGRSAADFLNSLNSHFQIQPLEMAQRPVKQGEFSMYLAGRWYYLILNPDKIPADPVARLDVSLLQDHLLSPLLGIGDPRRDKRIDFVGGSRGLSELQARVDSGEMSVAFALHPTTLEDLFTVADAGAIMPPKSTWFEPKLADGLLSHVLD